ncbi:hypothetical protein HAX54_016104 [Datura stramonium]|uniref:Agenet domain-containing protein n=1 Tax=Datura stramonium TaxID=4076 RepID=A0ABS8S089_DATST|nr:hypothetical protein [Datura stramonium]
MRVKSVEDGILGSWNLGTVIGCDDLFSKLNMITLNEIMVTTTWPLPPLREFARLPLPYGQCVDMFYNDAWWEGVIFDREEGDEERRIYFQRHG